MTIVRKQWITPDLQVFGDMQTLTMGNPTSEGGGGGTGATNDGQCSGKGCGTSDSLTNLNANNLTGWSGV